jgi:peptidoglycan/xylan/chitin deacetylase (PgdA/CDA1 family)
MTDRSFPDVPVVTPWPAGKRCAVLITFDVDVDSSWVRRGETDPVMLSMGHFEYEVGVPMILDLLDRFGIRTTFFVPGWVAERYTAMARSIVERGHEIGHHGYLHEPGGSFASPEDEEAALKRGFAALERELGVRPTGYRAPSWQYSTETLSILERFGIRYTSDLMDTLVPKYHRIDGRVSDMINLPVHWNIDDLTHIFYHISARKTILSTDEVFTRYKEEFDAMRAYGGLFTLTLHPRESGRPARLIMLKRFLDYVTSFQDVWIASPSEVVDYWRREHPLQPA